ncbi:polysaccharide deacetylase family protein, partial [Geoalkalibacter sp.]|uniref:polysaccharide deacetylase family protein n=1 Tax=Geoalkalibacter sp. TaxID=3041440 RepID=UPI00272DFCE0
ALRRIAEAGIEIGNHSAAHEHMAAPRAGEDAAAWRERMRNDLLGAQAAFREHLGREPRLFAYPYGEYSPALMELLRELGFQAAATQHSGVISTHSHLLALPRFPMGGSYATFEGFRDKLRMRALPVLKSAPADPLLGGDNPPWLTLTIDPQSDVDLAGLSFFVRGRPETGLVFDPEQPGVVRVRAADPLTGRRTNYTLTAPAKTGGGWYWYSHLWIRPEMPE